MNPNHRVPLTVARILVVGLPGAMARQFHSTSTMMMRATSQKAAPEPGMGRGKWLAAPIMKSMGMEKTVLVREARPARAPAAAAAGLAGLPAAVSSAFWMTIFCLGWITNQTLAHMTLAMMPPSRMTQV